MTDTHVIGAYAAQPPRDRRRFVEEVMALPGCTGLELPLLSAVWEENRSWLEPAVRGRGTHVLTLIPATMEALRGDASWGPASPRTSGRRAALDLLAMTRDHVERMVSEGTGVAAVELQSAPTATAEAAALRDTLQEIGSWDWCGASLVVEHCDAVRGSRTPAKGFLTLSDELVAVGASRSAGVRTDLGIGINWGRSAIDGLSADTPVLHILEARRAGLLRGLMLSGVADVSSDYGPAWADAHVAVNDPTGVAGDPHSLLTPERAREAVRAAGDGLLFDGVKVAVRPDDADTDRRLRVVTRAWRALGADHRP